MRWRFLILAAAVFAIAAAPIYTSLFLTGSTSGTLQGSDAFDSPIPLASPANRITITPRFGINPKTGLGFNVVSD